MRNLSVIKYIHREYDLVDWDYVPCPVCLVLGLRVVVRDCSCAEDRRTAINLSTMKENLPKPPSVELPSIKNRKLMHDFSGTLSSLA